ncbi:MAG: valine--tRNA ligase [Nanoarchaeota archaeon]
MLEGNYDAKAVEEKWQKYWEKKKTYKLKDKKKIYSIDTPPPTVSGDMHLGHSFSYAQQDFIVRFNRMVNGNVFYPFGTDDNGLPTEKLVEKLNNVRSKSMQRDEFIDLCLKTLKKILPEFVQSWKDLGISCDYDAYYSTIDDHSRKISQKSFIELYKKGHVYQDDFPTIFCVNCQTPIAQAELEDKHENCMFNTVLFGELKIATTRPELIPSCVAVFVNSKDKRYKKLIGKKVKVPLFDYEVPILSDESAEMDKGTGILMICSYGDKFDVDAIRRKKLEPRVTLEKDGRLNKLAGKYEGLKLKEARKEIINDLKEAGLLEKQEQIEHVLNVHDKCGHEIEFLPTKQWFIKILDKKKKFIELGKKINWHPKYMQKRYEDWVKGVEWDWSVSRERHFGIPIPLWQCEKCGEVLLADEKKLPIDPISTKAGKCKCGGEFVPETKVLDTWATSSLTPEIALSLLDKKFEKFIPMSLRPQAHDIIRTWAFYTIIKAYLHYGKIPWKDIVISGHALDPKGKKMSKSKGNVINPKEVMEKHSVDALRYWAASSKFGEDMPYQEKDVVTGDKLVIKLWNASKFSLMHLKDYKGKGKLQGFDKYLLLKLNKAIEESTKAFEKCEISDARKAVEGFFWRDFCDNYLEISKDRLYNPDKRGWEARKGAQYCLHESLLTVLKMFAPIMPHITEEIYQDYFEKKSIHVSSWPKKYKVEGDLKAGDKAIEIISKVRQFKTSNQKSLKEEVKLVIEKKFEKDLKDFLDDLKSVCKAEISFGKKFEISFVN